MIKSLRTLIIFIKPFLFVLIKTCKRDTHRSKNRYYFINCSPYQLHKKRNKRFAIPAIASKFFPAHCSRSVSCRSHDRASPFVENTPPREGASAGFPASPGEEVGAAVAAGRYLAPLPAGPSAGRKVISCGGRLRGCPLDVPLARVRYTPLVHGLGSPSEDF